MRSLWASLLSGLGLFVLHTEAYLTSGIFWIKILLVGVLLGNGLVMQVAERDAREAASESAWARLRGTAFASTALWSVVTLAGVLLERLR